MTLKHTDIEIIRCLKEGTNGEALKHLYSEIFPKIKSYILQNSGSEDDALDVFQDAVVTLCKQIHLKKYDEKYELAGFLYSVSRNLWINKVKRDKRITSIPENFDLGEITDFTDGILTKENEKTLKDITEKLGQKCLELLKQSVFYKTSSEEIIKKMGFSTANAVKTQKYKCKQKLLKIIDENPLYKEVVE